MNRQQSKSINSKFWIIAKINIIDKSLGKMIKEKKEKLTNTLKEVKKICHYRLHKH